jgi:hypothetical protein
VDKITVRNFNKELESKYPIDLRLSLTTNGSDEQYILLCTIIIEKKSNRNIGIGTTVMNEIISFSNLHKIPIGLNVSDIYGSDLKRLIRFYQKCKFRQNRAKRRFTEDMIYIPK